MEVSRAQHTTQAAASPPLITPDMRVFNHVTVRISCVRWQIDEVYHYVGARTAAQKRLVRRDLEQLAAKGVEGIWKEAGKRGKWWVASALARERFMYCHDRAMERRAMDMAQQRMDAKRRPMDTERTNPNRDLRIIAASHDLGWTSDGETRTPTGRGSALQGV